jgi:hypothetical protein
VKIAQDFAVITYTSEYPYSTIMETKKYLGHYTLATAMKKLETLFPTYKRCPESFNGCGYKWVDSEGNVAKLIPCFRRIKKTVRIV